MPQTSCTYNSSEWFRENASKIFIFPLKKSSLYSSTWPWYPHDSLRGTMAEVKGMEISGWITFVFPWRLSNLASIANRKKTSCRYLMTWKNVLNRVPSVKKKASSFPQFSMWSPIATLSGCISVEEKVWKDVFQHARPAYSLFDAVMVPFISLFCLSMLFEYFYDKHVLLL